MSAHSTYGRVVAGFASAAASLVAWVAAWLVAWVEALVDLVLPARCPGCGRGDDVRRDGLCAHCRRPLLGPATRTTPRPCPPGLPPCYTATRYDGPVRATLLAYKERGERRLLSALSRALAASVAAAVVAHEEILLGKVVREVAARQEIADAEGLDSEVVEGEVVVAPLIVLVPIPSTARAMRARGGDHLGPLARGAARQLRAAGWACVVRPVLAARHRPDSAGLSAAERVRQRRGAFVVRRRFSRWLDRRQRDRGPRRPRGVDRATGGGGERARRGDRAEVIVIVDDLVTTGATLAESARTLRHAGARITAAAVVAATVRRSARSG